MPLPKELNEKCGEEHYISDVFCEKRRWILFDYPRWLILAISALGLLAFLLVGFLGYATPDPRLGFLANPNANPFACHPVYTPWDCVFNKPWPLYAWFTVLVMTLQISVLRHPLLRAQLVGTLIVTLVSAVVMYWLFFYGHLDQIINDLLHLNFVFLRQILNQQWTYTILNFLLIGLFFLDTALRYARRAQGLKPDETLEAGREQRAGPNDPRAEEMAAGDLVAGTILFGVMALIFTYDFIHGAAALTGVPPDPNIRIGPDVATVPQVVPLLGGHLLTDIDRFLALLCLPVGFMLLAIYATLSGLSAVRAVQNVQPRPIVGIEGTSDSATAQVSLVLFNALRSAADRYVRLILTRILLSLGSVFLLILIFVASFSLAALALAIQDYLHHWPRNPADLVVATVSALVAVLSVTSSLALLLFSRRVATNSLRLLYWVGFVLALTFWLFSATMVGINWLAAQFGLIPQEYYIPQSSPPQSPVCQGADLRHFVLFPNPFVATNGCNQPFSPSILTFVSFGLLIVLGVWVFARRSLGNARGGRPPDPGQVAGG